MKTIRFSLSLALAVVVFTTANAKANDMISNFENPDELENWGVVNDTVMGGVSQSRVSRTDEGNLLFRGLLSLENNGGFASTRSRPRPLKLEGAEGILMKVRGDGRTYYLDLRARGQNMGGSFRASFETKAGEWQDVYIPFERFARQYFGRVYRGPALDPRSIDSIGFTLSDKKPGPFKLEVDYIKSDGDGSAYESPDFAVQRETARGLVERAIEKGVPLFNAGDPSACAAVYEIACRALTAMPEISDESREIINRALYEIENSGDSTQNAWTLRYALDDVMERLVTAEALRVEKARS